jgi:hypothetical protein
MNESKSPVPGDALNPAGNGTSSGASNIQTEPFYMPLLHAGISCSQLSPASFRVSYLQLIEIFVVVSRLQLLKSFALWSVHTPRQDQLYRNCQRHYSFHYWLLLADDDG